MNNENSPDQDVEKAQPLEEEEIIELTDEVTEASIQPPEVEDKSEQIDDDLASSIGIDDALEKEISEDQDVTDRFADSLGMDLEPEIDALEDIHEEVSLSPEHLEETLERIVKKMFSEKIEKMLAEMVEAAVSKEIKSIQEKLLDDESPDRTNP
jgi:Asp-tRNA(Asn)/Glu-tRNA(Gln) amidotransferase B subunit